MALTDLRTRSRLIRNEIWLVPWGNEVKFYSLELITALANSVDIDAVLSSEKGQCFSKQVSKVD